MTAAEQPATPVSETLDPTPASMDGSDGSDGSLPLELEPEVAATVPHVPLVEVLAWVLVVLAGAGMRLIALGARPLNILEGHAAYDAWSFAQGRVPPGWPGSLLGATEALLIKLFGAADAVVRFSPALAGTALVASLWLLRPWLGRRAALGAALLVALSPVLVVDARSASGQAWGALLAVLLIRQLLAFVARPGPRAFVLLCFLFCAGLGTDAVFVGLTAITAAWLVVRATWLDDAELRCALRAVRTNRDWLTSAAPLALAALLLVITRFGTAPARLRPAAMASFAAAFKPVQAGAPWHYLPDVLAGYELPLLVLASIGAVLLVRGNRAWLGEMAGLLLFLAAGGLLLAFVAASRDPSVLVLAVLPLALLGGVALAQLSRQLQFWQPDPPDYFIAASLAAALVFSTVAALAMFGNPPASGYLAIIGAVVVAVCVIVVLARLRYEGLNVVLLALTVLAGAGLLFELHGAGGAAFAGGDEYLVGQHTTPEAVAMAQLMEQNNGGVSSVTEDLLPSMAWYLRDTVRSGGHGQAQVIDAGRQPPAGFHAAGNQATLSRSWWPASFDAKGMVGWWLLRRAWGTTNDRKGLLVVEDQ